MKQKQVHFTIIVAGFLAACLAGFYVLSGDRNARRPTADLAALAAGATDPAARERAAVDLSNAPDVTPALVRPLLSEDQPVEVRAAATRALGATRNWDSIPSLLELCNDPDPIVRGRAGAALQNIMGVDYQFRADDPPEKRQRAIDTMRYFFDHAKPPPGTALEKEKETTP